jgi:hypothetical protein
MGQEGRREGMSVSPFLLAQRAQSECARCMRAVKGRHRIPCEWVIKGEKGNSSIMLAGRAQ